MQQNEIEVKVKRFFKIILCVFLSLLAYAANAQVRGFIVDAISGDSIPFASVAYKGKGIKSICDNSGHYSIELHTGWTLQFSALGYKSKNYTLAKKVPDPLIIQLMPTSKQLDEVVVKSKKTKYSRKDNPAVELMKRVVAAKQHTKLETKDYYQYRNYEKLTLSLNDISDETLTKGIFLKKPWLRNQVEKNPLTGKNTLPVIVSEKIYRKFYRKDPEKTRIYVDAEDSHGINELIETGEMINTLANEAFTEVDIYDDRMKLLKYPFTSPISKDGIGFYRYYINDTVLVDRDSCILISFTPNNQQDIGFNGDLWVIYDSTLQVKKVHLSIPQRSEINFIRNMAIDQQYLKLPSGEWVLNKNDMIAELTLVGTFGKALVNRVSRHNDFSFEPIDDKIFKGKAKEKRDPYSEMRDKDYWSDNREVSLTNGEEGMDDFLKGIRSTRGFGWMMVVLKAMMENYVETAKSPKPSYFDIGPINSMISANSTDGLRLRVSGQTTAKLNPHLFLKGFVAHGFKSKTTYYNSTITYSFNKKVYGPDEYPIRKISLSSSYDVRSPSDKFMNLDKDNVFAALKWSKVSYMAYTKRQAINFMHEEDWGFSIAGGVKFEESIATGDLYYKHFLQEPFSNGFQGKLRTSEAFLQLAYSPGQSYINSKQQRRATNRDAPIFRLKHTMGIKGLFGGEYNYHVTEASVYKRLWLKSWGRLETHLKGGIQWSQAPFPLLIAPAANLSLISQSETFGLINNLEFINDKYVSLQMTWDLTGKLMNRIPLLKMLDIREFIGINVLYAGLSDKNNPTLPQNMNNPQLMEIPMGSFVMKDVYGKHVPYIEIRAGVYNILKFLQLEYVRRLNYLSLPTANKHGVRVGFRFSF